MREWGTWRKQIRERKNTIKHEATNKFELQTHRLNFLETHWEITSDEPQDHATRGCGGCAFYPLSSVPHRLRVVQSPGPASSQGAGETRDTGRTSGARAERTLSVAADSEFRGAPVGWGTCYKGATATTNEQFHTCESFQQCTAQNECYIASAPVSLFNVLGSVLRT